MAKLTMLRCGTCGKRYTNPARHVCRTRLDRKTRPGKTRIKPRLTFTCGTCGKATTNPLTHTCTVRTDFRRRKAAHDRQTKAASKRARAAAKRRAAKKTTRPATRKPARPATPRPAAPPFNPAPSSPEANHDYHDCFASSRDKHGRVRHECGKYPCRVYGEGHAAGLETGRLLGHSAGYGEGYTAGYHQGHTDAIKETNHS